MATKASVVLEDTTHRLPLAELMSGAPSFEWTIPQSSSDFPVRHERTNFEPDNYQIAFVSFHNRQDQVGGNPPGAGRMGRLFLLLLTWREFVTRVRGSLTHSTSFEESALVRFGEVSIDPLSMEVWRSDCPVSLTAMEFKILNFFVANPNRVFSRDQLLNEVWGYENYPCSRTVDNHVLKLRQKLELEPAEPVHFRTVHGVGYKFIP